MPRRSARLNAPAVVASDEPEAVDTDEVSYTYPDPDQQPSHPWLGGAKASQYDNNEDEGMIDVGDAGALGNQGYSEDDSDSAGARAFELSDDGYISTEEDDFSDADEEFYTLQGDVADFQRRLRQKGHKEDALSSTPAKSIYKNRGGRRGPSGPRKPLEPPLEIKVLLAQANGAFVSGEYEQAETLCNQVLLMNDETYAAHALLSGIYLEQGEVRLGIIAYLSAAHLRPKDPSLWRSCAQLILEHGRERRADYLSDAIYCFSQLVRINGKDFEARYERALLVREMGLQGRAAMELQQIHEMLPHDTTVLRMLAEIYIDTQQVDKAIQLYREYIRNERKVHRDSADGFGWSDINVFVELFGIQKKYAEGIRELKSLSRWLLGREDEDYWEDVGDEDDREWDSYEHPRRMAVEGYVANRYEKGAYGDGLPLELRVKLGVYRLKLDERHVDEALSHFSWLEPENDEPGAPLFDYPDLFRETADALQESGLHNEALAFYEPLQQVETYTDMQLYFHMATSYRALKLSEKAEQCYRLVLENDARSIDARADLARMYEALGRSEEAFALANEVLVLTRQDQERSADQRRAEPAGDQETDAFVLPTAGSAPRPGRTLARPTLTAEERQHQEDQATEAGRMQYVRLQVLAEPMRAGDERAYAEWMETAKALITDFRSMRLFYPWMKWFQFRGYTTEARQRGMGKKARGRGGVVGDMEDMADRLEAQAIEEQARADGQGEDPDDVLPTPSDYHGIAFPDWVDIFCECAVELAKRGASSEAYDILSGAIDANVFYHSPQHSLRIHLTWTACAIILSDATTLSTVTRVLMKNHQFTTDTYRLASLVHLLPAFSTESPITHYSSGPSQKFLLRQIKAMDYALTPPAERSHPSARSRFGERAVISAKDVDTGETVLPEEMDVSMLMSYGQMLYVGGSYGSALSYFWRAHALITEGKEDGYSEPMVDLCLGLGYVHYALKRQAGNRHLLIAQGLGFLFRYYDERTSGEGGKAEERMEAEYNLGRVFQLLGLTHLAIPYYERALHLSRTERGRRAISTAETGATEAEDEQRMTEDFATETAYNLQNLYFTAGNVEMAQRVTEEWLVL